MWLAQERCSFSDKPKITRIENLGKLVGSLANSTRKKTTFYPREFLFSKRGFDWAFEYTIWPELVGVNLVVSSVNYVLSGRDGLLQRQCFSQRGTRELWFKMRRHGKLLLMRLAQERCSFSEQKCDLGTEYMMHNYVLLLTNILAEATCLNVKNRH